MDTQPVIKLLADLVAIPSVNPMGKRRNGVAYQEKDLAEFVASYLKRSGLDVEVYDVAPGRPNVAAFVNVNAAETLLLEAHLDTVQGENMTIEPFSPVVDDGRMYGRGSCDTKGSLAAFCHSVVSLLERGKKFRFNIMLLFVSDEEYLFTGARTAAERKINASFGIVGEPTGLAIVTAHKGVTRWRVRTKGLAAHSAYPERGTNAIYRMSPVVERLEKHARSLAEHRPHPLLGVPSLSVGIIEGGQAVNVVPDHCWIEVDRRSIPGETTASILRPISELLKGLPGVEIDEPYLSLAGMEVSADSSIVTLLSQAVNEVTGKAAIETAHYATDAGIYNKAGIPSVVFGPGDIAQAHTVDEFIDLRQLSQAVEILQRFITG